ncbi:MAG TPA: HAD-IB family hydrolase [Acidimicrobiales bacterium]|jgi:HAD superfamily hydrolase (TIGR01490 family)|nr:HAD-IB family hydrolase [Actinomycetes bacterium]MDP7123663.1 HAD-IB family hydrolase [Acidimicrobiales bacterium]MDP7352168.1 HAD-IB family hydrolase [Acidimicrobiales bacterium]HJL76735.1 HAD-IB family hydrolase [Acidimicrobiales bacterium]|tara:strand:- start:1261 stop:3591 length:2331 start_codon:yes stop_codon:yes gene_type:complete
MIAESLAGRRIAITGSTGFLGTALVERILRSVPDCELVLIVRPGRRGAERRVSRDILHNDAFDRLRSELGKEAFEEMAARRITAVAGDVTDDGLGLDDEGRAALSGCDLFIHSAAIVSFDSPLDQAVEINLLGSVRIVETLRGLGITPHLVAVSTCYVAGSRRGAAAEEPVNQSPFFVDVDWRSEVDSARRIRSETETASRTPEKLAGFRNDAHKELGAAGVPALSAKTELLRTRWVEDRMAEAGRSRASSLGFPDAYAYTKALGEVALTESAGDVPISIVRPSIIESALAEPVPGWIRGFRMAEPVIVSYARGLLKEFPGVPEGTVDVIPVDFVVAAICAVAARGPDPDAPPGGDIVQVASGAENPLRYGKLVDLVREWFTEHPIYDEHGQPISVPQWSFPGRGRVKQQLERAGSMLDRAHKAFDVLPVRGRHAMTAARLEEKRELVDRAMGYVDLYGAYAECEAVYGLERLLTLWGHLDDDDRAAFCFDPRGIDWDRYVPEVHLPSVVKAARAPMRPPSRGGQSRSERLRSQILSPDRHLAAFDLENTLIASNVVASYSWLASRHLGKRDRARFVLRTVAEAPRLLALDRLDRSDFLRYFYRRYEGAPVDQIAEDSLEHVNELLLARSFPAAIRRVREHRALGHRTVLITGALDFVVEPLRPLFDDVVCAQLGNDGVTYDGQLTSVPPTGEARYQALADLADEHGYDLRESIAYADSASDLPMLEAVGFPVAVNPETRLASIARKRGWLVEDFRKSPGMTRRLLPLAPPQTAIR